MRRDLQVCAYRAVSALFFPPLALVPVGRSRTELGNRRTRIPRLEFVVRRPQRAFSLSLYEDLPARTHRTCWIAGFGISSGIGLRLPSLWNIFRPSIFVPSIRTLFCPGDSHAFAFCCS